jgi:hypothetical protein
MSFLRTVSTMFALRYILTPVGTINRLVPSQQHYDSDYGFKDIYIFGVRIVRIQMNEPWE